MGKCICGLASGIMMVGLALAAGDEAPPPAAAGAGALVVLDAADREHKVTGWSLTAGTRPLSWLAPAAKDGDDKGKAKGKRAAPMALVIREELKIHFLAGVVTLVPLDRVRSISFDKEKETMTVRAATSAKPEEDVVLTGTTAYRGINKLTIRAEVDMGKEGVAEVTFQGGVPKGIKAVRFPEPKVEPGKPGRPAVVTTLDQDVKKTHKVNDLQALYLFRSGQEKLEPTLMFRKTLKLDLSKLKKITASSEEGEDVVWQVVRKDGGDTTLTLLTNAPLDGQTATLVGLVGKVPAGYVLFPARRIHSIEFDTTGEAKKKDDLIDTR
jgi:hypothetical protein